jgi:hypothetical protein
MEDIEKLVETLAQDAGNVRAAPSPFALSARWLAGALAYLFLCLAATGLRPDLTSRLHNPWFIMEMLGLAGILVASSLGAGVLAYPDLYQKGKMILAPGWFLALFLLFISFSWQADTPPAPLPEHSYQCTLSISLLSLLPAAWIFYSIRKFASTHAYLAGSAAVLYAFSVGAIWLRLHEVNDSIIHVIEWHYLPMLGSAILGMWLGKALLKW